MSHDSTAVMTDPNMSLSTQPDQGGVSTGKVVGATILVAALMSFLFWLALVGVPAVAEFDQLHEALRGAVGG